MTRILLPAEGPDDWKRFLAKPDRQWKKGYSARALAYCWHEADGFPDTVRRVFTHSGLDVFEQLEPLLVLPEHKVPLPGGRRPSQSDIWILGRSNGELVSIAVEGKVSESFGEALGDWLVDASPGKLERLEFLTGELGVSAPPPDSTRYQLMHRTASAIIEAKRFRVSHAMMLVHSFSQIDEGFDDYAFFVSLFDGEAAVNRITHVGGRGDVDLYFAWVRGDERYLTV